jgi:hypothetical protein
VGGGVGEGVEEEKEEAVVGHGDGAMRVSE